MEKVATLVVLHSPDTEDWKPVMPAETPEWVKEPDVMGRLVAGDMAHREGEGWYRVQKLADSPLLLPKPKAIEHRG